jgi:hypothetical protein
LTDLSFQFSHFVLSYLGENRSSERFFLETMMEIPQDELLEQTRMLIERLERVSVDSVWARRSSGVRGALLKWLERLQQPGFPLSRQERWDLEMTLRSGFEYLAKAARERFPE